MMPSCARPVYWHQGLFLQPQHFQLSERSLHAQLLPYRDHLLPHFWGVGRLEVGITPSGLPCLEIPSGAFLFPDGTHVLLPEYALLQPRIIPVELLADGPLTVYLGLKKWNDSAGNVTSLEAGATLSTVATRFAAAPEPEACADLHGGGPQGEVRRLNFVLRIFWETEIDQLGDYLLIPVAGLERGEHTPQLGRGFIPPCLTLGSSAALHDLVGEIRDQLASRSRRLEGFKRERGIQSAEFGSKDLVYLLALRTVNRYLAQLSHLVEARDVHPWQAYGVLRQLAAELSSFSETVGALGDSASDGTRLLPEYRHLDLAGCFCAAHDLVLKLLDQITAGPDYAFPLINDGSCMSVEMRPALFEGRNRFYLQLRTESDPEEVVRSVATLAKLSCRERLPLLIAQALPGISLEHLSDPPRELPRGSTSLYFAIDIRCDQWDLVRRWNNLALGWDQAPPDLEAQLMVVARP